MTRPLLRHPETLLEPQPPSILILPVSGKSRCDMNVIYKYRMQPAQAEVPVVVPARRRCKIDCDSECECRPVVCSSKWWSGAELSWCKCEWCKVAEEAGAAGAEAKAQRGIGGGYEGDVASRSRPPGVEECLGEQNKERPL